MTEPQCCYDPVTLTCPACGHVALRLPTYRTCRPVPVPPLPPGPPGAGHFLKKLLGYIGIRPSADCGCTATASRMDRLGPDWCEAPEGMAEILGVMKASHAKLRVLLPWTESGARVAVHSACALARRAALAASTSG